MSSEDHKITQHAPLVRKLALQLAAKLPACVALDDLIQAGMIGLIEAVRRYQVSPDAQFETYAILRIRGAMLDELRSQDWLPRSVRTKAKRIEDAMRRLSHRLMRQASEAEIAAELELTVPQYQALLEDAHGVQILHTEDLPRQHESGDALESLQGAAPENASPLARLMSQDLRRAVLDALDQLPAREKLVLSLQFEQDLNQREIARVLELTEGRVSQLRSQAVARIRSLLAQSCQDESPGDEVLSAPVELFKTA